MPRANRRSLILAIAIGLSGCASARGSESATHTDTWSWVSCAECADSHVAVDVRRSLTSGRQGSHLLARVRNLAVDSVVFVLTFRADVLPDADGYVPSEDWKLLLGPAGTSEASAMILLSRDDVSVASVSRIERFASGRATASKP